MAILFPLQAKTKVGTNVLNTYSQTALMLSIATEGEMLLMKLQVMLDRWRYHLPFKEACTVDFYDWSKKVEKMSPPPRTRYARKSPVTGQPISIAFPML